MKDKHWHCQCSECKPDRGYGLGKDPLGYGKYPAPKAEYTGLANIETLKRQIVNELTVIVIGELARMEARIIEALRPRGGEKA